MSEHESNAPALEMAEPRTYRRRAKILIAGAMALGSLSALWASHWHSDGGPPSHPESRRMEASRKNPRESALAVEVVRPAKGGLARKIVQTGSVEAFETAELFARVSGYLKSISVDIGDEVAKGQVIAEIDAPDLAKDVDWKRALYEQAQSRVLQSQARVKTAKVERLAAEGLVKQAEADVERRTAERRLSEKELARIEELVAQKAIERKLLDEKQYRFESAKAGEDHAIAAAQVAQAEVQAIDSRIAEAQADLFVAEADVRVAKADLARAQIMADYAKIVAPFSGRIIQRNWDAGAYVPSASASGRPLVTLARTDEMRVVIRIAAPDVPMVQIGQAASVAIDALGGETFSGRISRISHHQDSKTRTMRAEIDLPNADGKLTSGMYAAATVSAPALADSVLIPHECLVGETHHGRGQVYVLANGRVQLRSIGLGASDKSCVEVLWNLGPAELILANPSEFDPGLRDGALATITQIRETPSLPGNDPNATLQASR